MQPTCRLCQTPDPDDFHQDNRRNYFRCRTCHLIFVPPDQHLSPVAEKAEYDLHQNLPDDPGYRRFLSRIFTPMQAQLAPHSHGLDFGAGPGPTLSIMFEEVGHPMTIYDPFYAPDEAVFDRQYDFITASEVVEHLRDPQLELDRLWHCLKPDGTLGIMTKLALDVKAFARWHYKNDLTHICFYSQETFAWLADQWKAEIVFEGKDVVLFQKVDHADIGESQ